MDQNTPQLGLLQKCVNPSVEHVIAKYLETSHRLAALTPVSPADEVKSKVVSRCQERLDEVAEALRPRWCKKIFTAWHLLHRIDEEAMTLLDRGELYAECAKLATDIKLSSLPDAVKTDWTIKLDEVLKKIACDVALPAADDLKCYAAVARTAAYALNEHTDNRFWEIWAKRLLTFSYTVLLGMAFIVLLYLWPEDPKVDLSLLSRDFKWFIALLGITGGLASGIISGEREFMAKGHFWNFFCYYSMVRPLMGALAAFFMFLMLQCHLLLSINTSTTPPPGQNAMGGGGATAAVVAAQPDKTKNTGTDDTKLDKAIIDLTVDKDKELYAYALFLFLAGFSGDKLLKSVADRVSSKLFSEAEKTRESIK